MTSNSEELPSIIKLDGLSLVREGELISPPLRVVNEYYVFSPIYREKLVDAFWDEKPNEERMEWLRKEHAAGRLIRVEVHRDTEPTV